ncbi:hypothetical protein CRYUN_Cryun38cG0030800 [Craigia yunnanensis]
MAEAFVTSTATNAVGTLIVDYLVKPVERRLCYLFRLNKIVKELQVQEKNLTNQQARVQEDVRKAKLQPQTQVIEKSVEDWLTDVENALKDVQSLECRIKENKGCFRWCPNWRWRYQLSKKIEQKTLDISKLVESSKFGRVGQPAALPGIEFFEPEGYQASKSSTSAFNEIMEALKDDEVNMIGTTREGKAEELWLRLKNEEKVLIILDDMWNELNLKEIGIPFGENHKGCTIILTTRDIKVCNYMKSQVTVSLNVLDKDEAWTLFKMNASLDNASPDIIDVAKEVAKECDGLPIAIVTLARALRSKDLNGWELARDKLKASRLMAIENIPEEVEKNAYLCLETSYDHLRSETTRRCLLLCALYPEDYSIDVEDLVRYAWGLRLYQNAGSIHEVRREVFEAINNLKDSCLLEDDQESNNQERYIKVHDVVRDVAMWIASKEDNGLVTQPGVGLENESSKQKLEILLLDNYEGAPLNVISELLWNVEFLRVSNITEKDIKYLTGKIPVNVTVTF